jgi:hypothetical protein
LRKSRREMDFIGMNCTRKKDLRGHAGLGG